MKRTLKEQEKASEQASNVSQDYDKLNILNNTIINDLIDKNQSKIQQTRQIDILRTQENIQEVTGQQSIQQIMDQLKQLETVKYTGETRNDAASADNADAKEKDLQSDADFQEIGANNGQKPPETEQQRKKRLFQNKKSAQKCRLKKALEFETMRIQFLEIQKQNEELKEKLSQTNMILLSKIQENNTLQSKLEQNQLNSTMFLTNLLVQQKPEIPQQLPQAQQQIPESENQYSSAMLMQLYQQLKQQGLPQKQISPNMNGLGGHSVSQLPTQNPSPLTSYSDPIKNQTQNLDKLQRLIGQINQTNQNQKTPTTSMLQQRPTSSKLMGSLPLTKYEVQRQAKLQKTQNQSVSEQGAEEGVHSSSNTNTLQAQLTQLRAKNQPSNRTPQIFCNLGNFSAN